MNKILAAHAKEADVNADRATEQKESHGIERAFGLRRMNILQCQKMAQDIGYDSATFDLCGPKGRLKCKWLDAYLGLFRQEGEDGFMSVQTFQFLPDLWCENLTLSENAPSVPDASDSATASSNPK